MSKKGGGKALTGILCFIFGFLFAIIVEVGAVFGVGYVVLNTDVNTVMERVGYPNTDDKYINTDKSNGGSETIGDLIKNVYNLAKDYQDISVDKVEELVPAMTMLMNSMYEYTDGIVTFDKEKLESATVTTYVQVLQNTLINVHTAKFLDKLSDSGVDTSFLDNDGEPTAQVINALLKGIEADYATVKGGDSTVKFPVLYDTYTYYNGFYNRTWAVNGQDAYPSNLSTDYLCETTDGDDDLKQYKLFYVPCKKTSRGIEQAEYEQVSIPVSDVNADGVVYQFTVLEYGKDTVFIAVKPDEDGNFYLDYTEIAAKWEANQQADFLYLDAYARNYYKQEKAQDYDMYQVSTLSGINYFRDQDGNMIEYDPLLIYDIMTSPYASLYSIRVSSLIPEGSGETDTDLIKDILGNVTMGELLEGKVDIQEKIKDLEISELDLGVEPDNAVMAKIIYNLSDISQNANGTYSAIYDKGGENEQEVVVTTKDNGAYIYGAYPVGTAMTEENLLKGTTVGELTDISKNISVNDFISVKADDAILLYIGYGVSSSYEESGTDSEGKAYAYKGTYNSQECYISTDTDGKVKSVWYYVGGVYTEVKGTPIADVGDRVSGITDNLTLPDVMDVDADSTIMAYIGYGITGIAENSGTIGGKAYDHTATYNGTDCYLKTEQSGGSHKIISVWTYENGTSTAVLGTKISEVSSRVDSLTLPDVIDIDADSAILAYMGYGVTDVEEATGTAGKAYDRTATYEGKTCYIQTIELSDGTNKIVSAWTYENGVTTTIAGTKISDISTRFDTVTDVLALPEVMDVDADSALMAYIGYGITGVKEATGTAGKAYDHTATYNGTDCYLKTEAQSDGSHKIISVWTYVNNTIVNVSGTKISEVSSRVDGVTENLTIGDVIKIDKNSSEILKTLKNTKIVELDSAMQDLTVADVFTEKEINSSNLLKQLTNTKLMELDTAIDKISVQRIYSKEIYGLATDGDPMEVVQYTAGWTYYTSEKQSDGTYKLVEATLTGAPNVQSGVCYYTYGDDTTNKTLKIVAYNGGYATDMLYYTYDTASESYKLVHSDGADDEIGKLTAAEAETFGTYYTYGRAQGMWKIILYKDKTEKSYTINNFNNMVSTCATNVYASTLGDLQEAGIISASAEDLTKKIRIVVGTEEQFVAKDGSLTTDSEQAVSLADMTFSALMDVVIKYMAQ